MLIEEIIKEQQESEKSRQNYQKYKNIVRGFHYSDDPDAITIETSSWKYTGCFVYGYYIRKNNRAYIVGGRTLDTISDGYTYAVLDEKLLLNQFSGYCIEENGVALPIFEYDILATEIENKQFIGCVVFDPILTSWVVLPTLRSDASPQNTIHLRQNHNFKYLNNLFAKFDPI